MGNLSREFLEEVFTEAKKTLPGWVYAVLRRTAMSRAGGRARHRDDQPNTFEKIALSEIRPRNLRDMPEDELRLAWSRLHQWFANARRRRRPVEGVVNAALWTIDEFKRRGLTFRETELTEAVSELRKARDEKSITAKLGELPRDLVVVRDFISVVGSTAKGKKNPCDLDLLVRAPWDGDKQEMTIGAENVWLPVRNALDPEKTGGIHWIDNAQGAHGDHIPLYDLVMRRRPEIETVIVKQASPTNPRGWTARETIAHVAEKNAKFPQESAGYREPAEDPAAVCGACRFFLRDPREERGRCAVVDGSVAWFGTSDLFISAEAEARATFAESARSTVKRSDVLKSREVVPASGPEGAALMFVGSSPSRLDVARRESLVGPVGETFSELYLEPLGARRQEVAIANAVPALLTDGGNVREPTPDELDEWRDHLSEQIEKFAPRIVVALGEVAAQALGESADFKLPHPSAVRRFGDTGEVARKIRRVRKALVDVAKQKPRGLEEGSEDTRGAAANREWFERWHELLPKSGKGKFVYQHHWRGLGDDELKLSGSQLLDTDRSLHGDLRLEGPDGLWGWAVLIGSTADNKRAGGDKLIAMKPGDTGKLRLSPKLQQPKAWLDVGVGKPTIVKPGGAGATTEKSAKLFAIDRGTYQLGVVRRSAAEIFLDGPKLKGRYILQLAKVDDDGEGRRFWLIDKPKDQEPIADQRELADEIGELRRKRQKFLVWAKPGERPKKIDVRTGEVVKSQVVKIAKADPVKRIVYGVVLDPYGTNGPQEDAHRDWTPPAEIEKTAHGFMKGDRLIRLEHKGPATATVVESWVEKYPEPQRENYLKAMRGDPHKVGRRRFGTDYLHSGAWVLGVELGEKEWQAYQAGEVNAFSPGGHAIKSPLRRAEMPRVTFVELVEKPAA